MTQRLITIAIDFEDSLEGSVASGIGAIVGAEVSTINQAVESVVSAINLVDGVSVAHWSCPTTQNWIAQSDEISRLHQAIDGHQCPCCHRIAVAGPGVVDFEPGTCPPLHNCPACADTIV